MAYELLQILDIPEEAHTKPIPPEVLPHFDIVEDAPQADLLLAQVALMGHKEKDTWHIGATDALSPREPVGYIPEDVYGAIAVCGEDTTAKQAFEIGEDWIRNSEDTLWVPGKTIKIKETETSIVGLILVRGSYYPQPVAKPRGFQKLLAHLTHR